jgi:tetratricopeptide (TPR) repeat protein
MSGRHAKPSADTAITTPLTFANTPSPAVSSERAEFFKKRIGDCPEDPLDQYSLALILAACPCEGLRNPERAVELAEDLVQRWRIEPWYVECLGIAYYRVGKDAKALENLEKARILYAEDRPLTCLFLAMTHARLGDVERAKSWLTRGVTVIKSTPVKGAYWEPTRAEAVKLLQLPNP